MKPQEINGPYPCVHPWSSQPENDDKDYEGLDIRYGTREEHDKTVAEYVKQGFMVWIDGTVGGNTKEPGAYLYRPLKKEVK